MTAYYDFFRYIKLYSPDGTTLEQTIEADNVTDSINFIRGNGVAWNSVDLATDTFKFDVEYNLSVPLSTTAIRLTDVNNVSSDINLVAGGNMIITRDSANQLTIAALVGGVSKSIQNITTTNPVVITTTNAHAFTDGTEVTIVDVVGTTQLNGNEYFMDVQTSTTFALYTDAQLTTPLDGTGFTAYTSGGVATADYGGAKNAFKTIQVTGASPVVADNIQDILNLTGGTGIDITTTPGTDSIAWAIDSTVTTLVGSQTLTNKTLTSPIIAAIKPSASNSWALPDSNDTFVGKATTDTLTNKSVDLANNTLTTTIAQLNTAVSDESVVARDTTDTLTNKTISTTNNTITVVEADISDFGSYLPLAGGNMTGALNISVSGVQGFAVFDDNTSTSTTGPMVQVSRTKTGVDWDYGGGVQFNQKNDADELTTLATLHSRMPTVADGSEVGVLQMQIMNSGTLESALYFYPESIRFVKGSGGNKYLQWINHTSTHEYKLEPPATIAGAVTVTLPSTTDTLVGKATTDTLTNKTILLSNNTVTFDADVIADTNNSKDLGSSAIQWKKAFIQQGVETTNGSFIGSTLQSNSATLNIIGGGSQSTRNRIVLSNNGGSALLIQTEDTGSQDIDIQIRDTGTINLKGAVATTSNVTVGANLDVSSGTIKLDGNYPTGTNNVAMGDNAFNSVTTGQDNTCIGHDAGTAILDGSDNTFIGESAGAGITSGNTNTAVGGSALKAGGSVSNTVAIGQDAGLILTSGDRNTFVGRTAGSTANGGNNNICLGYNAEPSSASVNNEITLGDAQVETLRTNADILPFTDNAQDLGSSTLQWQNIYTGDLHLSNERHKEGNSVDGTTGNWTIQEGAEDLFIINNKNGKKFKFCLKEIE